MRLISSELTLFELEEVLCAIVEKSYKMTKVDPTNHSVKHDIREHMPKRAICL